MADLSDLLARALIEARNKTSGHPHRLMLVPDAVIEDVVAHAVQMLATVVPEGADLEENLIGEDWVCCESCDQIAPMDFAQELWSHDPEEGIHLCGDCTAPRSPSGDGP
jgi:hypothetical protein